MEITIPLSSGLALKIASGPSRGESYPTARLQKGLILLDEGLELVEEAVGFGVPILKRGLQTIFPGELELASQSTGSTHEIHARFKMNLEEKIARPDSGTINSRLVYGFKNRMAALIRQLPLLRRPLTHLSNLLRSTLDWETTYEETNISTYIQLTYSIHSPSDRVKVELDTHDLHLDGISEMVVMNEQGARHFDQYQDTDGISQRGNEIGCWDQVLAEEASFISAAHHIAFSLPQVNGAKFYRGRELIGSRLAWSGFGYSFSPTIQQFGYEITVKRL
jgi:hypothetical protein